MLHRLPAPFILILNSQRRKKENLCWKACIHYTVCKKSLQYSETVFKMRNKISLRAAAITPECWTREKKTQNNPPNNQKDRMQPNIKVICNRKVGGVGVWDSLWSTIFLFFNHTLLCKKFLRKKKVQNISAWLTSQAAVALPTLHWCKH